MKFLSNSVVMVAGSTLQRVVGFAWVAIAARLLGPEGLALIAATTTVSNTILSFSRLGIDAGTHVLAARLDLKLEPYAFSEIVGTALTAYIVLAIFLIGVSLILPDGFTITLFGSFHYQYILFGALVVACGKLIETSAYIACAALHDFKAYSIVSSVAATISGAFICCAIYLTSDSGIAWKAFCISQFISSIFIVATARKACKIKGVTFSPRYSTKTIKSIVRIGAPFYAGNIVNSPIEVLFQSLLLRGSGAPAVGGLRVVQSITSVLTFIPAAINGPMTSWYSERSDNLLELQANISLTFRIFLLNSALVGMGLCLLWNYLALGVYGSSFSGLIAGGAIAVAASAVSLAISPFSNFYLSQHKTDIFLAISICQAVMVVASGVFLIPKFGLVGVWVANLCGAFVSTLGYLFLFIKESEGLEFRGRLGESQLAWSVLVELCLISVSFLVAFDSNDTGYLCGRLNLIKLVLVLLFLYGCKKMFTEREMRIATGYLRLFFYDKFCRIKIKLGF